MTHFSLLETSQLWYLPTVDFWFNLDTVENRKTRLSGSQKSNPKQLAQLNLLPEKIWDGFWSLFILQPPKKTSLYSITGCFFEFQKPLGSIRHMYKVNMYNPAKTT